MHQFEMTHGVHHSRWISYYIPMISYRAWIPGLSDEAGAGSWLAATMKQFVQPSAAEVEKLESFVAHTLWGSVQNANGTVKKVRSTAFY